MTAASMTSVFEVTDGDIAISNLQSTRTRSWKTFWNAPECPGVAENILAQERVALEFTDLRALERLDMLVKELHRTDVCLSGAALIEAHVASLAHRFSDAHVCLARAERLGALAEDVRALRITVCQATGTRLSQVLAWRRTAAASKQAEDLIPLAALFADLGQFDEADRLYRYALHAYCGVSPFVVARICFLLGVLWGELHPQSSTQSAARWYDRAITYLPGYVRARVHLAEIMLTEGRFADAETVLRPAVDTGDPEALACSAKLLRTLGRLDEAAVHKHAAKCGVDELLERHQLAFADHGAAFYSDIGDDPGRALELACINVANRRTIKTVEQAYAIALGAGDTRIASDLLRLLAAVQHDVAEALTDY